MTDLWPIYIPSKGRPNGSTFNVLQTEGAPYTAVVEPQEEAAYRAAGHPVFVLPANDQGLAYVRNAVRDLAAEGWAWMLDDDVTSFYRRERGKCVRCSPSEALLAAQSTILKVPGAAIAGLEYQQFAWASTKAAALNSYCDVVVAIHGPSVARTRYDANVELKEDRDMVLQLLSRGNMSVRVQHHAFSAPTNGSNAGGLQDQYQEDGREEAASRALAAKWPGIVTFKRKTNGRPDAKINWRFFKA